MKVLESGSKKSQRPFMRSVVLERKDLPRLPADAAEPAGAVGGAGWVAHGGAVEDAEPIRDATARLAVAPVAPARYAPPERRRICGPLRTLRNTCTCRITRRPTPIRSIPIPAHLKNIPRHIVEAIPIRCKTPHRRRAGKYAVVVDRIAGVVRLASRNRIPPRKTLPD